MTLDIYNTAMNIGNGVWQEWMQSGPRRPGHFSVRNVHEGAESIELALILELRFGNLYAAVKNGLRFALHYAIPKVYVHNTVHANSMLGFDGDILFSGLPEERHEAVTVYMKYFCAFEFMNKRYAGEGGEHELRARGIMKKALLCRSDLDLPPEVMVIHLRSGDVFSTNFYQNYGQPPLAWYQACISAHAARHGAVFVIIVFEDRLNPCVNGLEGWCRQNSIPLKMQSGSLPEDYAYLMSARTLVDSRGTFTLAAKELNASLENLYSFQWKYCPDGSYFPAYGWENTPEQQAMMVNLPREKLILPENLYELSRSDAERSRLGTF